MDPRFRMRGIALSILCVVKAEVIVSSVVDLEHTCSGVWSGSAQVFAEGGSVVSYLDCDTTCSVVHTATTEQHITGSGVVAVNNDVYVAAAGLVRLTHSTGGFTLKEVFVYSGCSGLQLAGSHLVLSCRATLCLNIFLLDSDGVPILESRGNCSAMTANNVLVVGGTLAYALLDSGIDIFDLSDKQTPSLLMTVKTTSACYDMALSRRTAYVATEAGVAIYDVSNTRVLHLIGRFATAERVSSIVADVTGNLLYFSSGEALVVWDITFPTEPKSLVSKVLHPRPGAFALTPDGSVVVCTGTSVTFLKYSRTSSPTPVSTEAPFISASPSSFPQTRMDTLSPFSSVPRSSQPESSFPTVATLQPKVSPYSPEPTSHPNASPVTLAPRPDGGQGNATESPQGQKTVAKAKASANTAVALGLVSATGSSVATAGRLKLLAGFGCQVEDIDLQEEDELDWEFHPLRVGIGQSSRRYMIAAVVLNPLILVVCAGLLYTCACVVQSNLKRSHIIIEWDRCLGLVKFPGLIYIPLLFLTQGTSLVAARLIFYPSACPEAVPYGIAAIAVCIGAPVFLYRRVVCRIRSEATLALDVVLYPEASSSLEEEKPPQSAYRQVRGRTAAVYMFTFGEFVWVSKSTEGYFAERYGVVFESFKPAYYFFALVELGLAFTVCLLSAWRPSQSAECSLRNFVFSSLFGTYFFVIALCRPFLAPLDNLVASVVAGCMFVSVVLMTIGIWEQYDHSHPVFRVAFTLLIIAALLTCVKCAFDLVTYFVDIRLHRRDNTRKKHRMNVSTPDAHELSPIEKPMDEREKLTLLNGVQGTAVPVPCLSRAPEGFHSFQAFPQNSSDDVNVPLSAMLLSNYPQRMADWVAEQRQRLGGPGAASASRSACAFAVATEALLPDDLIFTAEPTAPKDVSLIEEDPISITVRPLLSPNLSSCSAPMVPQLESRRKLPSNSSAGSIEALKTPPTFPLQRSRFSQERSESPNATFTTTGSWLNRHSHHSGRPSLASAGGDLSSPLSYSHNYSTSHARRMSSPRRAQSIRAQASSSCFSVTVPAVPAPRGKVAPEREASCIVESPSCGGLSLCLDSFEQVSEKDGDYPDQISPRSDASCSKVIPFEPDSETPVVSRGGSLRRGSSMVPLSPELKGRRCAPVDLKAIASDPERPVGQVGSLTRGATMIPFSPELKGRRIGSLDSKANASDPDSEQWPVSRTGSLMRGSSMMPFSPDLKGRRLASMDAAAFARHNASRKRSRTFMRNPSHSLLLSPPNAPSTSAPSRRIASPSSPQLTGAQGRGRQRSGVAIKPSAF
ncbi:putative Membrane-associated protein [Diplonema papillatum]|nr:putative Membrane-associated protein [Diplonema papillatum]